MTSPPSFPAPPPFRWEAHPWAVTAVVAVVYAAVGLLAQLLSYEAVFACALWPSAGVALAAAVRYRWRAAGGVAIGSVVVNAFYFIPRTSVPIALLACGVLATSAVCEAYVCRRVVERWLGRDLLLDRFRSQLWFVATTAVLCLPAAVVGGVTGWLAGVADPAQLRLNLTLWWVGDFLGILTVTPLLLAVFRWRWPDRRVGRVRYLVFVASVAGFTALVFVAAMPLSVLLLIPLLWSSFYLPQWWTLGAALAVSLAAAWATTHGYGPFFTPDRLLVTTLNLYGFVLVLGTASLTVSAGLQNRVRRDFFDSAPMGIGVVEESTRSLIDVNAKLVELLANPGRGSLFGRDVAKLLYSDPKRYDELLARLTARTDEPVRDQFETQRADGTRRWLEVTAQRVHWDGGRIVGFYRDATRGRRRKRLTRLANYLSKRLADAGNPAGWMGVVLRTIGRQLGAERVSLIYIQPGRWYGTVYTWVAPDGVGEVRTLTFDEENLAGWRRQAELTAGIPGEDDLTSYELRAGSEFLGFVIVRMLDWLFRDPPPAPPSPPATDPADASDPSIDLPEPTTREAIENGVLEVIGHALNRYRTTHRLTEQLEEQKIANQQREAALQDLRRANDELNAIHELALVGIFKSDATGGTIWLNPQGREIDGFPPDARGEELDRWIDRVQPLDHQKQVREEWERYVAGCETNPAASPIRMRQQLEVNGKRRIVLMQARPTRGNSGELTGFVGVLTDITEIDHENALLRDCTALFGHNVMTPVTLLRTELDRLQVSADGPDDRGEVASAQRTLNVIEFLGKHARVIRRPDEVTTDPTNIHLPEFLGWLATLRLTPVPKPVDRCTEGEVPDWVRGAEDVLAQVLMNLLYNAAKEGSSHRITLTVHGHPPAGGRHRVTFAVEDDGNGIEGEEREKVIARLARSSEELTHDMSQPGTPRHGRGLSLCQILLRQVGSQLHFGPNAATGNWNRFSFTLDFDPTTAVSPVTRRRHAPLSGRGGVMVVEDDAGMSAHLAHLLLAANADRVATFRYGQEAIDAFAATPEAFALVLMDVNLLPGIQGYDACRAIRREAENRGRAPWIVCISNTHDDPDARRTAGFDAFVPKPQLRTAADLLAAWDGTTTPAPAAPPGPPLERWAERLGVKLAVELYTEVHAAGRSPTLDDDVRRHRANPTENVSKPFHELKSRLTHLRLEAVWDRFDAAVSHPSPDQVRTALHELLQEMLDALPTTHGKKLPTG